MAVANREQEVRSRIEELLQHDGLLIEQIAAALSNGNDIAGLGDERCAIRDELENLFAALPYLEDEVRAARRRTRTNGG